MYTYKYIGDVANVFINLTKDGHTWRPYKGATYDSPVPINHPLLELVGKPAVETDSAINADHNGEVI